MKTSYSIMTTSDHVIEFSKELNGTIIERKNRSFVDVIKGEVYTNTMLKDIISRFNVERITHKFSVISCKQISVSTYHGIVSFNGNTYTFECENCMDLIDLKDRKSPEQLLKCIKSLNIKERCDGATKSRIVLFLSTYF